MEKTPISEDEARRRVAIYSCCKGSRANIVIANDGSVEDTWRQVQMAWSGVQRAAGPPAAAAGARIGQTRDRPVERYDVCPCLACGSGVRTDGAAWHAWQR